MAEELEAALASSSDQEDPTDDVTAEELSSSSLSISIDEPQSFIGTQDDVIEQFVEGSDMGKASCLLTL